MDYTSTALLDKIVRWAAIPEDQPAFGVTDLLKYLNEEMESIVVPKILSLSEDYFIRTYNTTVPATSTTPINLPTRIISGRVNEIKLIPSGGNLDNAINITRTVPHQFGRIRGLTFYFMGNALYINGAEKYSGYTLQIWYNSRPNYIVETSHAALVSSVLNNDVTVVSVPSTWGGTPVVDVIKGTPHFDIMQYDQTSIIAGNVITLTDATGIVAGDYIALAGESPVCNLPYEVQNFLVQCTVVRLLEVIGATDQYKQAIAKYDQMEEQFISLITPRVQSEPKIINNSNGLF